MSFVPAQKERLWKATGCGTEPSHPSTRGAISGNLRVHLDGKEAGFSVQSGVFALKEVPFTGLMFLHRNLLALVWKTDGRIVEGSLDSLTLEKIDGDCDG